MIRVVRVVIEMEMEGEPHQYRVWREIEEMEITLKGKKREYETEEEALKSAKTLLGVRLLPIINAILP